MSHLPGMKPSYVEPIHQERMSHVAPQRELHNLLSFAGWSIDDVVDNPIARRDIARWYKLRCWMHRRLEVLELEKQWNPTR